MSERQMHLGVFWLGTGNHSAGWRYPGADTSNSDWEVVKRGVQTAERGKLDLFFISDSVAMTLDSHPSTISRFEPTALITALATVTSHIGLGATVSTSFSEPFNVARTFSTIDHISGGRAAWNVVTTSIEGAARNFGKDTLSPHDQRYEIAEEFVDVVRGLWDTWDDGAFVADKAAGILVDAKKVRPLNHQGRFFSVKGPLNIERSPQGHPIIIQAGGSAPGQALSARTADITFTVVTGDTDAAKTAYEAMKQKVTKYGRAPSDLAIWPGVMPIVAETDEQAREQLALLQSWLSEGSIMGLVSQRIGHDISKYPLDGPIPEFPATNAAQSFSRTLLDKARRDGMTLRDLFNVTAAARGHWVVCGTPKRIADTFEEWFTGGMADGFMVMPAFFPAALDDFVSLVVPELQRRGLFKTEYRGKTLRDHLGLQRVGTKA